MYLRWQQHIFLSLSLTLTHVWWQIMYARSPTCTLLPPPFPAHCHISEGAGWFNYAPVNLCLSHIRRPMVWAIFQTSVLIGQIILIPQSHCSSISKRYTCRVFFCHFWLHGCLPDTQVASVSYNGHTSMHIGRSGILTDISPSSVDIDQPPPFYGWNIADTA